MLSIGVLNILFEQKGSNIEIWAMGGFFFAAAVIVGTLTQQRQSALKTRAKMNETLNQTYTETLRVLVAALDTRDNEIGSHSERVTSLALSIAYQMQLNEKTIRNVTISKKVVMLPGVKTHLPAKHTLNA